MTAAKMLAVMIIPVMITACGTFKDIKNANIGIDFDNSARNYSRLVRWQEMESAASTYVSPSILDRYRQRIAAAKDVKITDYRVKVMECDPVKGKGKAEVEFDYYRPPSTTVHTLADMQKWSYEEESGGSAWKLRTLLPEFR